MCYFVYLTLWARRAKIGIFRFFSYIGSRPKFSKINLWAPTKMLLTLKCFHVISHQICVISYIWHFELGANLRVEIEIFRFFCFGQLIGSGPTKISMAENFRRGDLSNHAQIFFEKTSKHSSNGDWLIAELLFWLLFSATNNLKILDFWQFHI